MLDAGSVEAPCLFLLLCLLLVVMVVMVVGLLTECICSEIDLVSLDIELRHFVILSCLCVLDRAVFLIGNPFGLVIQFLFL